MLKFIKAFLIFVILYHILVTVFCYGIFGGQYQEIFSLARDVIWIGFIFVAAISQRTQCKAFLRTRKYPLIAFWVLLVFWMVISKVIGKGWSDIFIGIKYGVWYLWILFSAGFVWYDLAYNKKHTSLEKFLNYALYTLVIIVIIGFFWQFAKLIFPNFFTWIGYGPLDDFAYGVKPPLYYLTGYEWTLRRQGIFAGPNNYGYFLVAFLPIVIMFFKTKISWIRSILKDRCALINSLIIGLWLAAIVLTLSRSAIVWMMVVVILMFRKRIQKHRKIFIWILVVCILWLVGLSLLKGTSTLAHIANKFSNLSYVINQPLGYGLGSSGPAIHHNGSILPENYFIQLMIDIGTVGFLMWIFVVSQLGAITRALRKFENSSMIYSVRKWLTIGRIALLIMWMFLHVFEDSMVNYLFFILRGITTWYLSYGLKGVKIGLRDFWKKK